MLKAGLVGLPNVGKSTVFNALSCAGAKVSNYPFCTIDPNHGILPVPDPRLEKLGLIFHQQKIVPAQIELVDIAGLVKGASKGEGLGNQFLHHIREVDAILHVVRCFAGEDITHVAGELDPVRDIETVNLELILADLGRVDKRLQELAPKIRTHTAEALHEQALLQKLRETLNEGKSAHLAGLNKADWEALPDLNLLTTKPTIYLANIGEKDPGAGPCPRAALAHWLAGENAALVVMDGKLEGELAELEAAEREEFIAAMDFVPAAEAVIRACYQLLSLITFYTGVGAEVHSWAIPNGTTAQQAAGKIHSDMARGFIRAEVIGSAELETAGSWEKAKEKGLIRLEGKDYLLREGEVCYFRFSV